VRLQPKVEVELKDIALRLVAAGIGDTYLPSALLPARPDDGLVPAAALRHVRDRPRPGARLSAGVRELLGDVEAHMRSVAEQLDRSR
jgi:hypothetical protein